MEAVPQKVLFYTTQDKFCPFADWLKSCKDKKVLDNIRQRIIQLRKGNFGVYRNLTGDLYELKIYYGPGYRIYFAREDNETVLLLLGGTKRTQKRDIEKARNYLKASQE